MLFKPKKWTSKKKLVFAGCLVLLAIALTGFYLELDTVISSFLLTISVFGLLSSIASADDVKIRFSDVMATVNQSGMVVCNIELASIVCVVEEQRGSVGGVLVECQGGVSHFVPLSMFSEFEQHDIVQRLKNVKQ